MADDGDPCDRCVVPTATTLWSESCVEAVWSEVVAALRCYARVCTLLTTVAIKVIASRWTWWLIGTAIVIGLTTGPRVIKIFAESKVDVAKLDVRKYADEAYPQWLAAHPDRTCPALLIELEPYSAHDFPDPYGVDPWGTPYMLDCRSGHLLITSPGEDGRYGTGDDIRSDNL